MPPTTSDERIKKCKDKIEKWTERLQKLNNALPAATTYPVCSTAGDYF